MRRMGSFLVASVLVAMPCCGRTVLDTVVAGAGGAVGLGGITGTGDAPAAGGVVGTGGGSTSASGGVVGTGGTPATGGMPGAGGSPSASGGSAHTTDLDVCTSDNDCTSCTWEAAPTDSSQCTGSYCCGGWVTTKARCEANQAAWTSNCPNQFPSEGACACPATGCPGQAVASVACVGGQCGLSCPSAGDAAADVARLD
jgi:hypothetical protein